MDNEENISSKILHAPKVKMYDICHPSYYYINELGCTDPVKISTTFYVYIELCEVKRYWDVTYKYNKDLDLLYLEAKKRKNSGIEIFVPWPTLYTITLDRIRKIQQRLNTERITMVFKAEDSSSVMYRVSADLVKPLAPEVTKQLKEVEERKSMLEKEIQKNISYLYELAKSLDEQQANHSAESKENTDVIECIEPSNK